MMCVTAISAGAAVLGVAAAMSTAVIVIELTNPSASESAAGVAVLVIEAAMGTAVIVNAAAMGTAVIVNAAAMGTAVIGVAAGVLVIAAATMVLVIAAMIGVLADLIGHRFAATSIATALAMVSKTFGVRIATVVNHP